MATELSAPYAEEEAPALDGAPPQTGEATATALTVLFTAAAVLFISFIAVIAGLV